MCIRHFSDFTCSDVYTCTALLSQDEMQRAGRFHFSQDRTRYIASRGQLRTLLGAYLGSDPSTLQFSYSKTGKPELLCPGKEPILHFNVAHSGDVLLLAFARRRRVGIDVELVQRSLKTDGIAKRFFSALEYQTLRALPPLERQEAFFRCWTRKEAYLKAIGAGLALPLETFDVSVGAIEPARLLGTRPDAVEANRWLMEDLRIEQGYVAALAIEQQIGQPN